MILSIDPGYKSGSCIADQIVSADNFNLIGAIEVGWFMREDYFKTFFATNHSRLLAILLERYTLDDNEETIRSQIGSEIPSARVIGLIEGLAAAYNLTARVHICERWTKRQVTILPVHQPIVGLSKHNQDAYRIMRYYMKMELRKVRI